MASRTKLELAVNILRHLAIVDAQETPAAIDTQYVIARYEDCLAELADNDLSYWPSDQIPVVIFEPLTQLVALSCGPAFGIAVSPQDMENGGIMYRRRLRRHGGKKSSGLPAETENF